MPIKTIAVHVDHGRTSGARVDLARLLAERHEAHLIGLHAFYVDLPPALIDAPFSPEIVNAQQELAANAAATAEATFRDRTRGTAVSTEWRVLEGRPSDALALNGRYADLTIAGQTDPEEPLAGIPDDLAESVVFGLGGPVLAVPYIGFRETVGQRVVVAWNGSREAVRAVNDAIPLLLGASQVTILSIDPDRTGEHGEQPGADIALRLARHGIKVETATAVADGIGVGELLLARIDDLSADLLVMGAYGHSRLREHVLGGVTATILQQMTVPVLMSH